MCNIVTVQRVVNSSLPGGTCVVNGGAVTPTAVTCSPSSVTGPGTASCTGTLSGAAPSGGLLVSLSTNNVNASVPGSVTVASGATSFGFTANIGSTSSNQTAMITASANGGSAGTPLNLTVGTQSHSATLSWGSSSSSSIAGYNVYRGTNSGGPYNNKVNPSLVTGLNYKDSTVAGGQTYYYVLTAVNTSGVESAQSTQVTAAIPAP